jgi:hypothetical protein
MSAISSQSFSTWSMRWVEKRMGLALLAQVDQRVHQQGGVDRVEAAEGLVHDDEVGLVQQGGDELDLLLHALGELFGLLGDGLGDLQAFAPDEGALAAGASRRGREAGRGR